MSSEIDGQWYVRRGSQVEGPYTLHDFFELPLRSQHKNIPADLFPALLPTDLIRAPGQSAWQHAGTIKGLFNNLALRNAAANLKQGDLNSLQDAFVSLSQIINDPQGCSDWRIWWKRAECQQYMAAQSDDVANVISLLQSANDDFSKAVKSDPHSCSKAMWGVAGTFATSWFPQHPLFLPAYEDFFTSLDRIVPWTQDNAIVCAVEALGKMGREAAPMIPILESLLPRMEFFVTAAIQRISQQTTPPVQLDALFHRVESELQVYPTDQDRFDLEHPLKDEDLNRTESELVALLNAKEWAVRAKAACIIRCKVVKPKNETIRALFQHLGPKERRGNVRGQCVLGLAAFAKSGQLDPFALDDFVFDLLDNLKSDAAYPVRGIAGKALSGFASDYPSVIPALVSALAESVEDNLALTKSKEVNLQRALVEALGECGQVAEPALSLVFRFNPHRDDLTGEIIKAATIRRIASPDHAESVKSLKTILIHLRNQPIGKPTGVTRLRRDAALKAILCIPMDELLRKKLLLERLFFDDSAKLRCDAARALIAIDKDLATKVGGFSVLDRIGS